MISSFACGQGTVANAPDRRCLSLAPTERCAPRASRFARMRVCSERGRPADGGLPGKGTLARTPTLRFLAAHRKSRNPSRDSPGYDVDATTPVTARTERRVFSQGALHNVKNSRPAECSALPNRRAAPPRLERSAHSGGALHNLQNSAPPRCFVLMEKCTILPESSGRFPLPRPRTTQSFPKLSKFGQPSPKNHAYPFGKFGKSPVGFRTAYRNSHAWWRPPVSPCFSFQSSHNSRNSPSCRLAFRRA
jgi:hypothetical protein